MQDKNKILRLVQLGYTGAFSRNNFSVYLN